MFLASCLRSYEPNVCLCPKATNYALQFNMKESLYAVFDSIKKDIFKLYKKENVNVEVVIRISNIIKESVG